MLSVVKSWFDRYFSDEEAVVLFLVLTLGLVFVVLWGDIMAPVIASAILAFVLQGMVTFLVKKGVNKSLSVYIAFAVFIGIVFTFIFSLMPLVWSQLSSLVSDVPGIFSKLKTYFFAIQDQYPGLVSVQEMDKFYQDIAAEVASFGQWIVSQSLESVPFVITVMIYFIVVPLLVFFFLKDKDRILGSISNLLPANRALMTTVWEEMNQQFANYIRGKVVEIVVVGGATYLAFVFFDLNYGALLAILVGLSVVIPYIGAIVVTIPVTMIALFQFGLQDEFYYVMFAYLIIQLLDGNILVPLLFSEVVNLHPAIIIISVLFFGGVWGVWGVFFAIPLATLIKAVFTAWPRNFDLRQ